MILSPTSLIFTGLVDDSLEIEQQQQSFTIDFQSIYLKMCPQMLKTSLKMVNSIQNSINQRFKNDEDQLNIESQGNIWITSFNYYNYHYI